MSKDELAEFAYLWDGSEPGWVVLRATDLLGGFMVFHKTNSTALLIESESLNEAVCKRMIENGCEILDEMPPGTPEATVTPA